MRRPRFAPAVLAAALWTTAATAAAFAETYDSERHKFRVTTLAKGLDHPWGLAFLPNGDMLITEREGSLRLYRDGDLVRVPGVPKVAAPR